MYNALKDNHIAGAIASPFLSTLFAIALLASGQNSTITGTQPVKSLWKVSWDSACHNGSFVSWLGSLPFFLSSSLRSYLEIGTCPRRPSSLLSSLPISGSSILHLPSGLFHLQQGNHGEHVNAKWNTFLGYLVAIVLTILNFNLIVTTFIK